MTRRCVSTRPETTQWLCSGCCEKSGKWSRFTFIWYGTAEIRTDARRARFAARDLQDSNSPLVTNARDAGSAASREISGTAEIRTQVLPTPSAEDTTTLRSRCVCCFSALQATADCRLRPSLPSRARETVARVSLVSLRRERVRGGPLRRALRRRRRRVARDTPLRRPDCNRRRVHRGRCRRRRR